MKLSCTILETLSSIFQKLKRLLDSGFVCTTKLVEILVKNRR